MSNSKCKPDNSTILVQISRTNLISSHGETLDNNFHILHIDILFFPIIRSMYNKFSEIIDKNFVLTRYAFTCIKSTIGSTTIKCHFHGAHIF